MSDPGLRSEGGKKKVTLFRVAIWLVVAAVSAYLLITGIVGIIVKG